MLALARDDAAFLAGYLRRLRARDEQATVRVQVRGRVAGAYGLLPPGVLALVAVPLAQGHQVAAGDEVDAVVSAGRLRDILGDLASASASAPTLVRLRVPDAVDGPPALSDLPPRGGWELVHTAMAGELASAPHGALPVGLPDGEWREIVDAALELALLASPTALVRLARVPGWRRLQSPAGQVFRRAAGTA